MVASPEVDVVVVGAGPNGLAAATTLAAAGASVLVVEGAPTIGGGSRSAELTLPGYVHDICSAIHPLGAASPYLRSLPLAEHGLEWAHFPVQAAQPLDDGTAGVLLRSVDATAEASGDPDGYPRMIGPLVRSWDGLAAQLLQPALRVPRHPVPYVRFGLRGMLPATLLARRQLGSEQSRALFSGIAAHAITDLDQPFSAAAGLVLTAAAHVVGWPAARGGSQRIVDALASYLRSLGGRVETDRPVTDLRDLPPSRAVVLDLTPRQLLELRGTDLPESYRRRLARFRYGSGSFKIDYALDGPVPWTAEVCREAGTVHLAGTMDEVAAAERAVHRGQVPERPFVLVAQQSVADPTRAPEGRSALWAYCHVPHGSTVDMTDRIEAQIERFAPGFRDRVLARAVTGPTALEAYNPNYIGGDIAGGASDGLQLLARPLVSLHPYRTAQPGLFLCSSSTPPGGGVHGMCGYWAGKDVLDTLA